MRRLVKGTSFQRAARPTVFSLAWHAAGALCLANAALVLASMPLAEQARIAEQTVIVSAVVAIAFVLTGLLVLKIAGRMLEIHRLQPPAAAAPALADAMRGLLTSLIVAGIALDAILGLVAVAFLSRIGQGFAIFG